MTRKVAAVATLIIYDDNTAEMTTCGPGVGNNGDYSESSAKVHEWFRRASAASHSADLQRFADSLPDETT